jgi:TRAP-type mannitol/chloroaromatic compound transport system substrate-binding protein
MKRRQFASYAAIATAGAAIASCSQSSDSPTSKTGSTPQNMIQWRMATSWTKSIPIAMSGAEIICKRVSEMSNGKFVITPYAANEIVPGLEVMDAIEAGTVECGHTLSYYYTKKNSALAFAATLPFGLTPYQQYAWFYEGGGLEATNEIYQDFGIIGFPAGNTSAQMGGWFKRKVDKLADLKGLKMRIPGLGGQVMSRLGVDVKTLAAGDIYKALEKQEIDAAEWQGPAEDKQLGLDRVTSFYYYPGWWEPGTTYALMISLKVWETLPTEYQQMIQSAAAEANIQVLAQYDAVNSEVFNQLLVNGTDVLPFGSDILKAAHKASFELYDELSEENPAFKKIYEQWKAFRHKVYQWNQINELSFAEYAWKER